MTGDRAPFCQCRQWDRHNNRKRGNSCLVYNFLFHHQTSPGNGGPPSPSGCQSTFPSAAPTLKWHPCMISIISGFLSSTTAILWRFKVRFNKLKGSKFRAGSYFDGGDALRPLSVYATTSCQNLSSSVLLQIGYCGFDGGSNRCGKWEYERCWKAVLFHSCCANVSPDWTWKRHQQPVPVWWRDSLYLIVG